MVAGHHRFSFRVSPSDKASHWASDRVLVLLDGKSAARDLSEAIGDVEEVLPRLRAIATDCYPGGVCSVAYCVSCDGLQSLLDDPHCQIDMVVAYIRDSEDADALARLAEAGLRCLMVPLHGCTISLPVEAWPPTLMVVPSTRSAVMHLRDIWDKHHRNPPDVDPVGPFQLLECNRRTLHLVLSAPLALGRLTDFAVAEHSTENILFHCMHQEYLSLFDGDRSWERRAEIQDLALSIVNRFIRMHSPQQVNLSYVQVKSMCDAVAMLEGGENLEDDSFWSWAAEIFVEAAQSVLCLIERNLFTRFWEREGLRLEPYLLRHVAGAPGDAGAEQSPHHGASSDITMSPREQQASVVTQRDS
mmetsp:Transcript_9872/g.28016  ORF Transcript_9872/g.28016 Transcript_9872/m.28016 type:complete len:359 (-) Transcript_9872:379-1455(-)